MTSPRSVTPQLEQQISSIREFNRFYTARLGLLRKRYLEGEFSLTEARLLYEVRAHPHTTAASLRTTLELDAGYLSRLLASLTKKRLIRQTPSRQDAREKHLTLSATGAKAVERLNEQSTKQLQRLLEPVGAEDRQALVTALHKVHLILREGQRSPVQIERLTAITDDALALLVEYYEAVHVVQRDRPEALEKLIEESGSGMWLAYRRDEPVGCVVLRRLASLRHASECKRLYVKPEARGDGIAGRLLEVQEEFARSQGVQWIYLDSYDDLKAAIALYERRGYQRCERYNDNPQATLFMRKKIA